MANRGLPMRKIKEVLRLKYDCRLSAREIVQSCNVARGTVADYLMKAQAAGLSWLEAAALTDTQIEERLFPAKPVPSSVKRPEPNCEHIYNELRTYRKFNLTLIQLWLEYKEEHPDGYVEVDCAYYAVPDRLLGEEVRVYWDERLVRICHQGQCVGVYTKAPRRHLQWPRWVPIGPQTGPPAGLRGTSSSTCPSPVS